jgi:hypothetical protein
MWSVHNLFIHKNLSLYNRTWLSTLQCFQNNIQIWYAAMTRSAREPIGERTSVTWDRVAALVEYIRVHYLQRAKL